MDIKEMTKGEHRINLIYNRREEIKDHRAKHKILPPSKFGLVQITRQRVRPEMNIKTSEENPNGNGAEVEAPIVLIDKIQVDLERILKSKQVNNGIILNTHPFIAAYLTKGFPSIRSKWFMDHKKWVKIQPRDAYKYLEYRFKNKDGKTIHI